MDNFWILIFVSFFATTSLDKTEFVQLEELEELPLQTFDELFVDEWWDKDEAEDLTPTNFGQIEPNSIDQNPPLTESVDEEQDEIMQEMTLNEKHEIIDKFHEMKDEFKQKGKYSVKEWVQIEEKIAKALQVTRTKIYKWKKEFGLSRKVFNEKEERKHLIEKFDQKKAELTRDGFKNSYKNEIDETVAKELGLSFKTIYNWKRKLGQSTPNYSHSEQNELMKRYYEIKNQPLKIRDADIAKMLNIGKATLFRWKRQFTRQQFHPNSVDGHSVEENAAANVQEIGNLGSI